MSQDYKVTQVSEKTPRQWDGPHGTVFYIGVYLGGHPKPVSIGKKTPDALKVGDTVYGDIESTTYPEDKFKAAKKPEWGSQPAQVSASTSQQVQQFKDMSQPANVDANINTEALRQIYAKVNEANKKLDLLINGEPQTTAEKVVQDMGEPLDVSSIPF